ncbi:FAD:protein FMN transferase [Polaribacter pacificus]|uniref:FAD:protein FMN transferase n=1 Tax=Polaribacter pacificus TaxID=1775173 RepID=A0A917MC13_9FLAO|nr:FAD:protein FMN transferase [Polaribacter pacificus]GGG91220.1 FAD:protein FMN transferase [Polaribacter pacificus]
MKRFYTIALSLLFITCTIQEEHKLVKLEGLVFGTTYHISYLASTKSSFQSEIDSLFALVNKSLSTYIPTSDISKINKGDSTVVVDPFFTEVFQKSKEIYKDTDGYFDPTIGMLVNAWGFGPEKQNNPLDSSKVEEMMAFVGLDKIQLIDNRIKKKDPRIYLDFNSIAKGYGVDVIARFLEGKQISNYLVEIGGEIRARGTNAKDQYWKVAIEKPNTDGSQSFETVISLKNQSMATSGNYRKFRISKEGKKYVHTVNPKTGFAKESNLLSASVISNSDCADVDAYATAFMAMGFEKARELVESQTKFKVFFMYLDVDGNIAEYAN